MDSKLGKILGVSALVLVALGANETRADHLQMDQIRRLARDVEVDTSTLRNQARAEENYFAEDYYEQEALENIDDLDRAAADFRRSVDSYRADLFNTRDEFNRLNEAFFRVEDTIRYLEHSYRLELTLERIQDSLGELRYHYRSFEHPRYPSPRPYPPRRPLPPHYPGNPGHPGVCRPGDRNFPECRRYRRPTPPSNCRYLPSGSYVCTPR